MPSSSEAELRCLTRRKKVVITPVMIPAAATLGVSNGKRDCGSEIRTIGITTIDSAIRTTPRSPGTLSKTRTRGLRPGFFVVCAEHLEKCVEHQR